MTSSFGAFKPSPWRTLNELLAGALPHYEPAPKKSRRDANTDGQRANQRGWPKNSGRPAGTKGIERIPPQWNAQPQPEQPLPVLAELPAELGLSCDVQEPGVRRAIAVESKASGGDPAHLPAG